MALLQIGGARGDDPPAAAARKAVGIDLGTTNSLVAFAGDGAPAAIEVGSGEGAILPSVVRYASDGSVLVGAEARSGEGASDALSSVKRLIGRSLEELKDSSYTFDFVDRGGMVCVGTEQGAKSPVEVSSEILKRLRDVATRSLGTEVREAVITVPAHFDDAQRQATKDAAGLAGIKVLRLLNEPTAAAVAYGLDSGEQGTHVVYDLGGGTFDVSVLRLSNGVFEVIATGGDASLGGDDFDAALARGIAERSGLDRELPPEDWRALLAMARAIKEDLGVQGEARGSCALSGGPVDASVTREEFDRLTAHLLDRTMEILDGVMIDAKIDASSADAVVLVGGSTRMPCVGEAVGRYFGFPPRGEIDPDRVVAYGAAIQADTLCGNRSGGPLLLDVIPLSLGIEIGGGLVERVVHRNTTVPIARAQQFTTQAEGQRNVKIHVVQGERELAGQCRSLATFILGGLPPLPAGVARLKVTFQVDMDGLLTVSAVEESTGSKAEVAVKPSYGLGEAEIEAMLRQSYEAAEADRDARSLIEAREEVSQLVSMLKVALEKDGNQLLQKEERDRLEERIREAEDAIAGDAPDRIRGAGNRLDAESETFAERRMDLAVKGALKGRAVGDIG